MPKVLITVDDLTKLLMDKASKLGLVESWSPIAKDAFRAKLDELELSNDYTKVAIRLRAIREVREGASRAEGRDAGDRWARLTASQEELERLEKLVGDGREKWEAFLIQRPDNPYSLGERLFFEIMPQFRGERMFASMFWMRLKNVQTGRMHTPVEVDAWYARFFAGAALQVWAKVKPYLSATASVPAPSATPTADPESSPKRSRRRRK